MNCDLNNGIKLVCLGLLGLLVQGCATKPPPQRVAQRDADVYYGGVYLVTASQAAIDTRFPQMANTVTSAAESLTFQRNMTSVFADNKQAFDQVKMTGFEGELAPNDAIVMGCAFTGEKYFSEVVDFPGEQIRNVRAYLGGALLLQHFQRQGYDGAFNVKLLACYPFSLTCIGLVKSGETVQGVGGELLKGAEIGLMSDAFTSIVTNLGPRVVPVTGLGAAVQIDQVRVAEKATEFVKANFDGDMNEFKPWLAGELGAQLSRQVGLSVIPYAENTSTRRLAVMMQNGSSFNINLPDPDYVVDIDIHGFSKAMAKQTATESVWIYGAYGKVAIRERGTGAVRWEAEVKAGVPKRIAASQISVDHSVAQFAALVSLLDAVPKQLLADKKARPLLKSMLK